MIKLDEYICTEELSQTMLYMKALPDSEMTKPLWLEAMFVWDMRNDMRIFNPPPPSIPTIDITQFIQKVNINPVWFAGSTMYQFPVLLIKSTKWKSKTPKPKPLTMNLKCCIKVNDQILPIVEFNKKMNPGKDYETVNPQGSLDQRKMIVLARQLDFFDEVWTRE